MVTLNKPVEMISTCSPEGELRPLRFRLEAEDQSLVTVSLRRIEDIQECGYVGVEAMLFLCRGVIGGRERLFELRYTLRSHRWVLSRFFDR